MKKGNSDFLSFLCMLLLVGVCTGQATAQAPVFAASVSASKVAQNAIFEIRFELQNANGQNFQPPSFENFKVIAGPSTSSSTMIMNGQMSQSESWTYSLLAIKEGKFTIGTAKVVAGRKLLSTSPVTIEVVKSKGSSEPGITTTGKENVLLVADLDSSTYYPGQQILLQYKLLFNQNVQSVSVLTEDDYADFFIQNLSNFSRVSQMETVNGKPYTSRVMKSLALFAHQSGTYTIDPMIMDVGLESPFSERRGFFSMRSMEMTKAASAPRTIRILPLPSGAPDAFSGAVGHYTVKSIPGQTDISTDDAFVVSIEIIGDGDSKRWDPPKPVVDGNFEMYDPRIVDDKLSEEQDRIIHHRTIEYQMIPQAPGQYKIIIPLVYFNPNTKAYETAKGDTIRLNVTQGINQGVKKHVEAENVVPPAVRKVRNITTDDRFWTSIPHLFLVGLILSGSLWGMVVSYKQRRDDAIPSAEKIRLAAARHATEQLDILRTASSSMQDVMFFERATEIFYKFLSEKLAIPPSELDLGKIRFYLDKSNASEEVKKEAILFFEQCLSVRYGAVPGGRSREEMLREIQKFTEIL